MLELVYHLERESRNNKHYLALRLNQKWTPEALKNHTCSALEKQGLQLLLKHHFKAFPTAMGGESLFFPAEDSFSLLKLVGATGRLFYQGKKVVVDPFTSLDFHVELEKVQSDVAQVEPQWRLKGQAFSLQKSDWVFLADPSWVLYGGIIRSFKEEVSSSWVRWALQVGPTLEGKALFAFLEKAQGEVSFSWKGSLEMGSIDPLPFLVLADRHGAFADLWFDYGSLGVCSARDKEAALFRNKEAERLYEKDLFETDFIKKQVGETQYYCPLDRVTKSLTFLLEVGWGMMDAKGRKVVRQERSELEASLTEETVLIQGRVRYADHVVDLKDIVGAFNRREQFVEISPRTIALIDREGLIRQWGDLLEEEVTSEGMRLKKNRAGLLAPLLNQGTLSIQEDLRSKLTALIRCQPSGPVALDERFKGVLFAYQQKGVEWLQFLYEGRLGGLLADEMGLGKTVQVLAFFSRLPPASTILIVVPTSLLFNWQREIETFVPSLSVYRHEGKERFTSSEELQKQSVILTSYALLRIDVALFQSLQFQIMIVDEAQGIKNPDSQIAEACCSIQAQTRIAITGTPIENRLEDLWSIFHFLQPDLLGERKTFQAEVLAGQSSSLYLEKTKRKIRPFLLRRKKEEVALQLPPKLEQTVFVEMTEPQRAIYEDWLQKTRQGLLKKVSLDGVGAHRMEILEAILRLRQICAHPWLVGAEGEGSSAKFERLLSDLKEVIDEGHKVLVYSQFTSMLRLIESAIKERQWGYVYLDGSTKNREGVVLQFQEDPATSIFLISLKAGGVGLNLTAADYVFLYDPWWNEAVERQAIDRAHRMGRHSTVIARRYITALSIEEKILRLKAHKTTLSEAIFDFDDRTSATSLEELLTLLI